MNLKRFGKPKGPDRFRIVFYVLLFLLLLIDTFIHKHAELFLEKLLLFFPLYGFFSCLLIFGVTKGVMKILKRGSDYYEQ